MCIYIWDIFAVFTIYINYVASIYDQPIQIHENKRQKERRLANTTHDSCTQICSASPDNE